MLNVCHYYRDSEQMFAVAVLNNRREYWFDGFSISTAKLNPQNGYYGFYWMFECFENEQAVRVTDRHAKVEYVAYLWYSRSDALCCQSGLVDIYYNQVLQLRSVRSFQQLLLLYNTSHALLARTTHDKAGSYHFLMMGKTTTWEVKTNQNHLNPSNCQADHFYQSFQATWIKSGISWVIFDQIRFFQRTLLGYASGAAIASLKYSLPSKFALQLQYQLFHNQMLSSWEYLLIAIN